MVDIALNLDIRPDTYHLGRSLVELVSAGNDLVEFLLPAAGDHHSLCSGSDPYTGDCLRKSVTFCREKFFAYLQLQCLCHRQ